MKKMLVCFKCRKDLPVESFAFDRSKPRNRQGYCRDCMKLKKRIPFSERKGPFLKNCERCGAENPPPTLKLQSLRFCSSYCSHKAWAEANRDKVKANYEKRKPERWHKDSLKYAYGMTKEDYERMFKLQKGECAICFKPQEKRLHVDHDHKTGKIRGLLCSPCNKGLGHFADNTDYLMSAVKYLNGHYENC